MEYVKGQPYFCQVQEKIKQYPYLNQNFRCDILVVGGGIEKEHEFRKKHNFQSMLFTSENNPFPFEIMARTNFGDKIFCKKIILATGFNFSLMKEKNLCERVISYTIVTKPIKGLQWKRNALIQDDNEPYHYLCILPDARLIFGGEDTKFKLKPISDKLAQKKYAKLLKELKNMLPAYAPQIEIDYQFCGAFGTTENNLGLIGQTENPNLFYFLSAGANGIINAMFCAQLIDDLLQNRPNPLAHLFSPLR